MCWPTLIKMLQSHSLGLRVTPNLLLIHKWSNCTPLIPRCVCDDNFDVVGNDKLWLAIVNTFAWVMQIHKVDTLVSSKNDEWDEQ